MSLVWIQIAFVLLSGRLFRRRTWNSLLHVQRLINKESSSVQTESHTTIQWILLWLLWLSACIWLIVVQTGDQLLRRETKTVLISFLWDIILVWITPAELPAIAFPPMYGFSHGLTNDLWTWAGSSPFAGWLRHTSPQPWAVSSSSIITRSLQPSS